MLFSSFRAIRPPVNKSGRSISLNCDICDYFILVISKRFTSPVFDVASQLSQKGEVFRFNSITCLLTEKTFHVRGHSFSTVTSTSSGHLCLFSSATSQHFVQAVRTLTVISMWASMLRLGKSFHFNVGLCPFNHLCIVCFLFTLICLLSCYIDPNLSTTFTQPEVLTWHSALQTRTGLQFEPSTLATIGDNFVAPSRADFKDHDGVVGNSNEASQSGFCFDWVFGLVEKNNSLPRLSSFVIDFNLLS